MKPTQDNYPVFEANQVLTDGHLNEIFNYLDEQDRLTRANLIGIGIVCGLEIRLETAGANVTIHLTKGCGVTSEGYLIVEPEDVTLVSYREYKLPDDLDYQPFKDKNTDPKVQYPLWEMFPAGEPETTLLGAIPDFVRDKAALLFLELKKESLRNCSPNNCDDKGAQITATVRRLLIKVDDLTKVIAEANELGAGLSFTDLETALLARLNLPDLRLPRFDVPNTGLATSNEVFAAFHSVFQVDKLALNTGSALTAAYNAFKPVVEGMYPTDPFASLSVNFGFLDTALQTTAQVRFIQYYYDFFDDLIKAYDEFRWKGLELMCACCPPEGLFPRHLMLGVLFPTAVTNPGIYRHHFLPSSGISGCEERIKELELLFQRLVEMIDHFTHTPSLPQPSSASRLDVQIRLTPSKWGDVPVSGKAIPYYYLQNGIPPLYHIWNAEKSRRNRANQNLSYRSEEYTPTAPAFITNALAYDLEPHDFLRIEGHLGKDYRSVLNTLLSLKTRYRLPIEIIALRTGVFDENVPVDQSKEECRFQDLETLYDTLRDEYRCFLAKELTFFYDLPVPGANNPNTTVRPTVPLLVKHRPDFLVKSDRLGALFESHHQQQVFPAELLGLVSDISNTAFFRIIFRIVKLDETLTENLGDVNFDNLVNRRRELEESVRGLEIKREERFDQLEGAANILQAEEIDDRLEAILFNCRLDAFQSIHIEYQRRIREVKQKQFLSFFLRNNPGIQHKAGVPLGGTFIIVYHDDPERIFNPNRSFIRAAQNFSANTGTGTPPNVDRLANSQINTAAISDVFARISANRKLASDPDIRFLLGTLTGQIPDFGLDLPIASGSEAGNIIDRTVDELIDGTVIADFFLPYLFCWNCSPIQYVLPAPPLGIAVQIDCTNANGTAEITIIPQGGTAPFTYQLDAQPFLPLTGKLLLSTGTYTLVIRDSAGAESTQKTLIVPRTLTTGIEKYIDDVPAKTYQVSFNISGGKTPYRTESGTVTGTTFTSAPVNSGETISVVITDSAGCEVSKEFQHTVSEPCNLPCGGQSRRCAYRLWVQPPMEGASYQSYRRDGNVSLRFNSEDIEVPGADALLRIPTVQLNEEFQNAVGGAVKNLNSAINQALVKKFGAESGNNRLVITYEPVATDPFGVLWIEHFVCETFNLEFIFSFSKPQPAFSSLTMRYTNEPPVGGAPFDGALFINRRLDGKETRVPAFDCSERNQCSDSDYKKLCESPDPMPEFVIESLGDDRFSFKGEVVNTPVSEITAWVWDVFVAQPDEPFYEGNPVVDARLLKPNGPVRLTVITQKGCFGFAQNIIEQ